jgi:hypothetical protein
LPFCGKHDRGGFLRGLRWIAAIVFTLWILGTADVRALDLPGSASEAGIAYAPVEYEPAPPPSIVGIKAERRRVRRGDPALIVAWVSPCKELDGQLVRLLRDGRLNGSKYVNRACTVRFHPRVRQRTVFRAELVREDDGALFAESRWLTVKIDHRRR